MVVREKICTQHSTHMTSGMGLALHQAGRRLFSELLPQVGIPQPIPTSGRRQVGAALRGFDPRSEGTVKQELGAPDAAATAEPKPEVEAKLSSKDCGVSVHVW